MTLKRLVINHFRNIEQIELTPSTTFNFIIGDNGSGKTSLLEAIYTLGHGRAFRHTQANRIIQHEHTELVVFGHIQQQHIDYQIGLSKTRDGSNTVRINGNQGNKIAELAKLLPIQLITPEGFSLLNGGPKYRRAFLDWGCFHAYSHFFPLWTQIKRLLKQRNAALRQTYLYRDIQLWDKQLIPLAEQITQWRDQYANEISQELIKTCHDFLPDYTLECQFFQGWDKSIPYAELLERQFERDRQFTYTTLGPHKADFRLRINNIPVEDLLSRGQLKLLMCALRLAQGEHFTRQMGRPCLYLIDDFASELDMTRRNLLAARLKATQAQVFVSAISEEQIRDIYNENDKKFNIICGKIVG